jgi:hypothetical protein
MSGRERTAVKELKDSVERIRGTIKGFRFEGRDLVGSVRAQPVLGALERRGPLRKFLEKRPKPVQEFVEKKKTE